MSVELPTTKKKTLRLLVKTFKNKRTCKIRDFAHFVGHLIAACPATNYGWLYTRLFEREKYIALQKSNMAYI